MGVFQQPAKKLNGPEVKTPEDRSGIKSERENLSVHIH
jgi:hypothetical protein